MLAKDRIGEEVLRNIAKMTRKQLRLPKVQAALKGLLLLGLGIFLLTAHHVGHPQLLHQSAL